MNELTALLGKVAPWLAAAAGGPATLAAQAIKTAAQALGASSETISGVSEALAGATPESLAALSVADQDFQIRMKALGLSNLQAMEGLATADRANARQMNIDMPSKMPALLSCALLLLICMTILLLAFASIPDGNKDILFSLVGALLVAFTGSNNFWFGTTRGSADKDRIKRSAQDQASQPR
jgi:hypothetical protein